jgi:putative peptide zinc metalloprotease protein
VSYALAAFLYRIFISLSIAAFVAQKFFFFGVVLALLAISNALLWPFLKGLHYLAVSPRLDRHRGRALLLSGLSAGAAAALLFAAPAPLATIQEGVVAPTETRVLRADADGDVALLLARSGEAVVAGQPILRLADPLLDTEAELVLAELAEMRARFQALPIEAANDRDIVREQARKIAEQGRDLRERAARLTLLAGAAGTLLVGPDQDLQGRYIRQGDLLGYVVAAGAQRVQVLLAEDQVDLVQVRRGPVTLRLVDTPDTSWQARDLRIAPSPTHALPHPALADMGGGPVAMDPANPERSLQPWYRADLTFDAPRALPPGLRVYVRFDHGSEPLGYRLWRFVRRQFLSRFDV